MESYPGELLVGVFPLVFCVDATLKDPTSTTPTTASQEETSTEDTTNVNDFDNPPPHDSWAPTPKATTTASSSSSRSQFDRFLDAIAAALLDSEEEIMYNSEATASASNHNMISLFRADDDGDSDEEDEMFLLSSTRSYPNTPGSDNSSFFMDEKGGGSGRSSSNTATTGSGRRNFRSTPSIGINFRLGRNPRTSPQTVSGVGVGGSTGSSVAMTGAATILGLSSSHSNTSPATTATTSSAGMHTINTTNHNTSNTSYAKALQHGQGFFQRARLISISTRHGFPPSKDPEGAQNRIEHFFDGKTLVSKRILATVTQSPLDGILPSGWLEKHSHALPSAIMIVVRISADEKQQQEQDEILIDTIQNLQYSLAPKRACQIHVVGLVQEGVSMMRAERWSDAISEHVGGIEIAVLDMADILQTNMASMSLKQLHKSVRDSSLSYYLSQARRTKEKLQRLGEARRTPLLLPLTIRYCFKVAIFYEFQWNHEKSVRFMSEAYRYAEIYHRYLVHRKKMDALRSEVDSSTNNSQENSKQSDGGTNDKVFSPSVSHALVQQSPYARAVPHDEGVSESVELTLQSQQQQSEDDVFDMIPPPPPEDMVYQCRAVADWLNFKILNAGFTSHTEAGLLAASAQWQKHGQAFCNSRKSFVSREPWTDWAFVSHQRVVVSQLLERHPPRALGGLGNGYDEVLLRCSPWRTYESAAEALLRLAREVQKALKMQSSPNALELQIVDDMRPRYVGGLDSEGFAPQLQEESKTNHREKALDCIIRAISLFERDLETERAKTGKSHFTEGSWSRSGARMHYLAGGILLGMGKHADATPYLEKAVRYAKGWSGLELVIRRMLIECYEKKMRSQEDSGESSETIASMILDSYFNSAMSNNELRRALENFSSLRGTGAIKWHRDCIDEADSSLPFSFALTFPSTTHATVGDGVNASVFIRSNLDYAVHVNSVTMQSLAGPISIPPHDLLSAKNANEGSDGGIIIQAKTEILISTQIELPKDLDSIAIDESGNGGQKEGVAGKGSFAKSAKPRTAGITSAAGARLVSEKDFDKGVRAENGQWSVRFLGGKPLRCDGMTLVFYPVHVGGATKNCDIELTIKKHQPKTAVNIKRTPFEEDNYIASAWSRPRHLPLSRGPRCLRVLPPIPYLTIINVTESYTKGKVLEGTVNRILLRLQAGPEELCTDLRMKVSCSSLVITLDGKTKRIVASGKEYHESGSTEDMKDPLVRTPVLVSSDPKAQSHDTEYGYSLPDGWTLLGDGQGAQSESVLVASMLKSEESTFAYFDLYRPSPKVTRMEGVLNVGEDTNDFVSERDICQTDFDIAISYRQQRPAQQVKRMPIRRRNRKKPTQSAPPSGMEEDPGTDTTPHIENTADLVLQEFNGTVMWSAPISASFSPGIKNAHPCGSRHPSNAIPDPESDAAAHKTVQESEMVLIDGERVTTRCVLEAVAAADGLAAEIQKVGFVENIDETIPCLMRLVNNTGSSHDDTLYLAKDNDPGSKLLLGSKLSLAWTTEVKMKQGFLKGSVSSHLGLISVAWLPTPIAFPIDENVVQGEDPVTCHGPLRMTGPSMCHFMGPPCYIESAPFEVMVETMPSVPRVAVPFEVHYRITNKTYVEQKLIVALTDPDPLDSNNDDMEGVLIAGISYGDLAMNPFESHVLSYTALATRAGKVVMPNVSISSERYKTWVVNQESPERRTLFVVP